MSLILARSPYFISNEGFDEGALLSVYIGVGSYTFPSLVFTTIKQYSLNFRQQTELDISPLIRDSIKYNATYDVDFVVYVGTTVTGDIAAVPQSPVTNYYYATDGYSFYEDGYNYSAGTDLFSNSFYAGSNTTIYKLDDSTIRIPLLATGAAPDAVTQTATLTFYLNGNIVKTESVTFDVDNGTGNAYKTIESTINPQYRIEADGGVFTDSKCLQKFLRNTKLEEFDKITITETYSVDEGSIDLTVKTISECKYQPYEIIFKNRYGVEESLWFFKKSEYSLNTERESYRGNAFAQFKAGDLSYHTYQDYNVNGKEMMVLNSGFLEESFSENFKQLALSEKVYIMKDNVKLPVILKSKDITYKQSVNEKLIDYRIEVEFAYDKLNNIV